MSTTKAVRGRTVGKLASAVAVLAFAAAPAYAAHDLDFELDGNIISAGTGLVDWNSLFDISGVTVTPKSSLPAGFQTPTFTRDFQLDSNADTSTFTTGSKDILDIAGWQCNKANNVNDKTDLLNAYATIYVDPVTGHRIVYFGQETASNEGTRDVGFWLLQDSTVGCDAPTGKNTTFTGHHKDGDILIVAEYTGSSGVSTIKAFRWVGGANGSLDTTPVATGQDCRNVADGDAVCARTNGVPLISSAGDVPWPTKTKTSNPSVPGLTAADLDVGEFFEGGLDLTANNISGCFATFLADTRSSATPSATIFDYTSGPFQQCSAKAKTEIHAGDSVGPTHTASDLQNTTVPVGTKIHDKIIVDGTVGFAPPQGASAVRFDRFANADCSGTPASQETVNLTQTVAATATTAGQSAAESSTFTPAAGSFSYRATYLGTDPNYPDSKAASCEKITIAKSNSAVNTDILNASDLSVLNKKIGNGTTIHDSATITGSGAPGTPDPTGTVTFQRFANANCSGTPVSSEDVTITADGAPNSGSVVVVSSNYTTSAAAGEFVSYKVIYSGDSFYSPSTASVCEPICSFTDTPAL